MKFHKDLIDKDSSPIGFSFPCPLCGSKNTYYSAREQNWVCGNCGLEFDPHTNVE